jgi:hypothetical protein
MLPVLGLSKSNSCYRTKKRAKPSKFAGLHPFSAGSGMAVVKAEWARREAPLLLSHAC